MTPASLAVVAVALVVGVALMWRVRTLSPSGELSTSTAPPAPVTVVVPARNEATRLPRLLTSLHDQTRPADRVVVVDDGSDDGTAEIAAAAAGVEVIRTGGPEPGWAGKTWACHLGTAAVARGHTVVLLDADVCLAPDALRRLVAEHSSTVPDGLLSVQPFHETERAYEQLSAVANLVPMMASGMAAVRAPTPSTVAFGPCLVTTHTALVDVGGFAAVRASTIEDVALAARYAAAGRPVRCVAGGATVRFRMYGDGLRALVDGWTKNLAGGATRTPWWSTAGATIWVAGALAATAGVAADPSVRSLAAYVAVAAQTAWMLRRIGRFRWWTWALFPVPTAAFVVFFARSVLARGVRRSVDWRGRRIAVGP